MAFVFDVGLIRERKLRCAEIDRSLINKFPSQSILIFLTLDAVVFLIVVQDILPNNRENSFSKCHSSLKNSYDSYEQIEFHRLRNSRSLLFLVLIDSVLYSDISTWGFNTITVLSLSFFLSIDIVDKKTKLVGSIFFWRFCLLLFGVYHCT